MIEEHDIPTVTLTMAKEIAEVVKPPRSLYSRFPFGSPMGQPREIEQQQNILRKAFHLLEHARESGVIVDSDISYK